MATFVTSSTLPKSKAKETTLTLLGILAEYLVELGLLNTRRRFTIDHAISQLRSYAIGVKGSGFPFAHSTVLDLQFIQIIDEIINFRPAISRQLREFLNAHFDMMSISASTSKEYNPTKFAMENQKKILEVNSRYSETVRRFGKRQNDRILLYALFYAHILKTETIEFSFVQQFKDELKRFKLDKKYDAEEIFSILGKVQKGKEWKTDGRAIRDCLGHNAYTLEFKKRTWSIHFHSTKKGHIYNKKFSKDVFIVFMNNTDLLYRSSLMILFAIIAITLIKQHFLK